MSENQHLFADLFSDSPSDWKVVPFQEAVDFQEGPGILAKDFYPAGIPLIRLKGIQGATTNLDGANFLCEETVAKRWSHFRLQEGDLLLSSSASLGRVSEVDEATEGAVAYTGIIRMRPATKEVDRGYIKYFTQSSFFLEQIRMSATGSVINHFGPTHLKQMGMLVPTFPEQKAIAHILGTLDDKIELNRKANETLEAMAKALFKSWFVDFDPVRAKAEGCSTGLSAEISDLFPDSFEDSELGEIPSGWSYRELQEIGSVIDPHPSHRAPEELGEGFPFAGIGDIDEMGNIQRQKARVVGEDSVLEQESCYEINENSTGFGRVGTVGKVVRLRKQSFRYALSPTLAVIKPIRPCFSSLCFLLLKSPGFQSKVVSNMTGSTRPAIGIQILRRIPTLLPPASSGKIYEYFEDRVGALIKKGDVLNAANLSLIEARDTLLPKLISGEICGCPGFVDRSIGVTP